MSSSSEFGFDIEKTENPTTLLKYITPTDSQPVLSECGQKFLFVLVVSWW